MKLLNLAPFVAILGGPVAAGPVAWAACQTACNVGYGTCLAALGLTAGTAFPPSLVALAALCSAAQGTCMAACTPLLVAPTP